MYVQTDDVWNPATYNWENEKYLASIMSDSVINCDKFMQSNVEAEL